MVGISYLPETGGMCLVKSSCCGDETTVLEFLPRVATISPGLLAVTPAPTKILITEQVECKKFLPATLRRSEFLRAGFE